MILVDTSIWSLALGRRREQLSAAEIKAVEAFSAQISQGMVKIIGPVRQELLSGVRDPKQFEALRKHLRDFPDEPLSSGDFETAASISNRLRGQGIASTPTDCLIAAVASVRKWSVFTADGDFSRLSSAAALEIIGLS